MVFQVPKIKNAGVTFLGIGALLIPFCGAAWYNFTLQAVGIPLGLVWALTSSIALFIYIALAFYVNSAFYTYLASFSSLSLVGRSSI